MQIELNPDVKGILVILFFGAIYVVGSALDYLVLSFGISGVLKKCERKPWQGFVPVLRYYRLSECVNREHEGRVYMLLLVLNTVLSPLLNNANSSVFGLSTTEDPLSKSYLFVSTISIGVALCALVYDIRIMCGLCEMFGQKKRWVALLELPGVGSWILLWWGRSKKFPPVGLQKEQSIVGAEDSGTELSALKDGLTVNIRERRARDGFKEKVLLRDIHLNIPKGHLVLLLGGSGAGKTTFLNAVTGYEPADADILLGEHNVYKQYDSMKYDVGFVPQSDLMRGNDTVLSTLMDAAILRLPGDMTSKQRRERVQEVLESMGLSMLGNTLVEKLSGGQRKRLSIALEIISDPMLFILDEPDSGLDGVVARGLFEKLRSIADEGKIVVVITHTPDRVIDLFDDVIVLAKDVDRTGRLAYYGPVDNAFAFFGKNNMEDILRTINQKEEGGEGRATEYVGRYAHLLQQKAS